MHKTFLKPIYCMKHMISLFKKLEEKNSLLKYLLGKYKSIIVLQALNIELFKID